MKKFPGELRLVEFRDDETNKIYRFITNNFTLAASTIAAIYKHRWQIELCFKWIKQNLKIKSFLGTSENAVRTQIWVALIHYLLAAYIKFISRIEIFEEVLSHASPSVNRDIMRQIRQWETSNSLR